MTVQEQCPLGEVGHVVEVFIPPRDFSLRISGRLHHLIYRELKRTRRIVGIHGDKNSKRLFHQFKGLICISRPRNVCQIRHTGSNIRKSVGENGSNSSLPHHLLGPK